MSHESALRGTIASRARLCTLGSAMQVARSSSRVDLEQEALPTGLENRYRIVEKIGAGGYGDVYRAFWNETGTEVALKVLKSIADTDVERIRFRREGEVAKRLRDPHSVRVFDFGQEGDGPSFIAFELVTGTPLRQLLSDGPMPEARAVAIVAQIAQSLAEAHALDIVHRDIKPSNILVVDGIPGDFVKVLDFGIAKVLNADDAKRLTATGQMIGTPAYMAPEQISGGEITASTDVYALALVFCECLLGERFVGKGGPIDACVTHLAPEPHVLPKELGRFAALLSDALEKNPQRRLSSMAAFRERLLAAAAAPDAEPAPVSTLKLQRTDVPVQPRVSTEPMPQRPAHPAHPASSAKVPVAQIDQTERLPKPTAPLGHPLAPMPQVLRTPQAASPAPGPAVQHAAPLVVPPAQQVAMAPTKRSIWPRVLGVLLLFVVIVAAVAAGWFARGAAH